MFGMGVWELAIVFAIVLVLFGAKRLPSVATGLGQAITNFREALKGGGDQNSDESAKLNAKNSKGND